MNVWIARPPFFGGKEENMKEDINNKNLRLISVSEACERLGVSHWSIYQLINQNALKTVKIRSRRLISLRSINRFIEELEDGDGP